MGTEHSRTLTLQQLKDKRACARQVGLFKELFGTEVIVTVQVVLAVYDKFDWSWAAQNFLSTTALVEYDEASDAARAECIKVCADARAEFYKSDSIELAKYDKVCTTEYNRYKKARAAAFATAYINDSNY